MEYGRLDASDLARVQALLAACRLPTADVDAELLRYFIGARMNGDLVGTVAVQPLGDLGLLRSLAVDSAHRGLGIGSRLCDEAESLTRAGGMRELYLLTTEAASYFMARGYAVCDRAALPQTVRDTAEFRELCPRDAVVMHKRLSQPGG